MKLSIVAGFPGAGKTTLIRRLKGFMNLPAGPHFLNAVPGDWQLEPLGGPRANALVCIGPPGVRDHLTAALGRCIINLP